MKVIYQFLALPFLLTGLLSCEDVEVRTPDIEVEITIIPERIGHFTIINMGTNDSIRLGNKGIEKDTLQCENGNIIKMIFEPLEEYKNCDFILSSSIDKNITIDWEKGNNSLEYPITSIAHGYHIVALNASAKTDTSVVTKADWFVLNVKN